VDVPSSTEVMEAAITENASLGPTAQNSNFQCTSSICRILEAVMIPLNFKSIKLNIANNYFLRYQKI